ncbi:hypothetical protein TSAR_009937 [Trichomalopsis sarcophagae]|uniref:Uncharacterized protein n=1 Tax=Trichomalopsis sarcophagae TaxID=543379 RepID=A0A232EHC4_9HYME|nr:hypothetical protein TSAR_009937 [Trichomalopsis sarcophagae]
MRVLKERIKQGREKIERKKQKTEKAEKGKKGAREQKKKNKNTQEAEEEKREEERKKGEAKIEQGEQNYLKSLISWTLAPIFRTTIRMVALIKATIKWRGRATKASLKSR